MLIYIMGRAHTGSTILDILMGNAKHTESIGQLVSHIGKIDSLCSCGETIRDCPFWTQVRTDVTNNGQYDWAELASAHVKQGHVKSFLRTLIGLKPANREYLRKTAQRIEHAIQEVSQKLVIVDSSKEPTRALFFAKYDPDARFIYLVRDPRSIMTSYYWRFKDKWTFHFLRREWPSRYIWPLYMVIAAASWILGNLLYEIVHYHAKDRTIRVRYEDLVSQPDVELTRIGQAFDLDYSQVIDMIERDEEFPIHHNIGGNQIREEGKTARFQPKKDLTRPALPLHWEVLTILFNWPLMGRYQYPLRWPKKQQTAIQPTAEQP